MKKNINTIIAFLIAAQTIAPTVAFAGEVMTKLPRTADPMIRCTIIDTNQSAEDDEMDAEWIRINRDREAKLAQENEARLKERLKIEAAQKKEEEDLRLRLEKAKKDAVEKAVRDAEEAKKEEERKKLATSILPISGTLAVRSLAEAMTQIGKPYVWGAEGPDSYDCSGLVLWAYNRQGYFNMPRTTKGQWLVGNRILKDEVQRGDLIYFLMNKAKAPVDHVGIYIGDGKMLHAPRPGAFVEIKDVPWSNMVIIRRHE